MTVPSSPQPLCNSRRFDFTLVGDTDLDILLYGLPEILPAERELLANAIAVRVGGSGAITAHNLAALGNSVGFITTLTGDDFGALCQTELRDAGVDLSRSIPIEHAPSGVTVHLQHQERRHMFTYAGATFQLTFQSLDLDYLANARHFHMCSYYLQRALTPRIPELFNALKQRGVTISLDPNDDPAHRWDDGILEGLRFVDVLMPNEREACLMAKEPDSERAVDKLRQLVPLLIIKRGAMGASAYNSAGEWYVPARSGEVVDAVGAGDSFNAGFLHGWLRKWPIEKALAFGNLAGGWSTRARGGTAAFCEEQSLRDLEEAWKAMEQSSQSTPQNLAESGQQFL
jgi:sugar/nucleoside kinase (ribokinase family)